MCIGVPMQVLRTEPGYAICLGRGEQRRVNTALIDAAAPGDWVLVFMDSVRERISAARAEEVNTTLDMVQAAMDGQHVDMDPGFVLPSAMSPQQLQALAGATLPTPQETP